MLGNCGFGFAPVKPADRLIEWVAANRPHMTSRILVISETALSPGAEALLDSLEIPALFAPFTTGELVDWVRAMLTRRLEDHSHRKGEWPSRPALAS